MTAWVSFGFTARSTPLTISVPSSSATCRFLSSSSAMIRMRAPDSVPAPAMLAAPPRRSIKGSSSPVKPPNHVQNYCMAGGHAEGGTMADARQPTFGTALVAVLAGGAISSWISAAFIGIAPATSVEAWAILTSICGAVGVKVVLRALKFNVPFAFAAGALMAGRVVSLALVQTMPDLGGHAIPAFPTYGLFTSFPSLVLSAWLVQSSAGRIRTIVY